MKLALSDHQREVPASRLLGAESQGLAQVTQGFGYRRALPGLPWPALSAPALSGGRAAATRRDLRSCTRTRASMGIPLEYGVALWEHQGVSFPQAEAETQPVGLRSLCPRTP